MTKKLFGVMAAIICSLTSIFAQNTVSLKDAEKDLEKRCKETVDAYTYHVEYIADKHNSDKVKDDHIKTALEYFVGNGEGIKILDANGNPVMEDGAYKFKIYPPKIEITSRYRPTTKVRINTYLQRVKAFDL